MVMAEHWTKCGVRLAQVPWQHRPTAWEGSPAKSPVEARCLSGLSALSPSAPPNPLRTLVNGLRAQEADFWAVRGFWLVWRVRGQGGRLEGGPEGGKVCSSSPRQIRWQFSLCVLLSLQSGDDLRVTAPVDLAKDSLPAP